MERVALSNSIHHAVILLGSNIDPQKNIRGLIHELKNRFEVIRCSPIYETLPVGTAGSNFLNMVVVIKTEYDYQTLKTRHLKMIENLYGRRRTSDKFAPRTADLDILLFDGEIMEPNLTKHLFICKPLSVIFPDFVDPESKQTLAALASKMEKKSWIQEVQLDS